ncbi:hypothetical protein QBC35DRAFT_478038 [Podospora australis]|uniref:Uncharacterized protein n=1 Tax=Podospora australis TaxID=1536484 RepID=A0AAN6WNK9_9PEZI|nr:hypothetical protein QBC35DRAFT_478038 [Podospora australis]
MFDFLRGLRYSRTTHWALVIGVEFNDPSDILDGISEEARQFVSVLQDIRPKRLHVDLLTSTLRHDQRQNLVTDPEEQPEEQPEDYQEDHHEDHQEEDPEELPEEVLAFLETVLEEDRHRWPTLSNVRKACDCITKRAKRGHHALIYFSGHGFKSKDGDESFLCLLDRQWPFCRLAEVVQEWPQRGIQVTLVATTCYAGNMIRNSFKEVPPGCTIVVSGVPDTRAFQPKNGESLVPAVLKMSLYYLWNMNSTIENKELHRTLVEMFGMITKGGWKGWDMRKEVPVFLTSSSISFFTRLNSDVNQKRAALLFPFPGASLLNWKQSRRTCPDAHDAHAPSLGGFSRVFRFVRVKNPPPQAIMSRSAKQLIVRKLDGMSCTLEQFSDKGTPIKWRKLPQDYDEAGSTA